MSIVELFAKKIQSSAELRYGREIIALFASHVTASENINIVDLGAGTGIDLDNVLEILKKNCIGTEIIKIKRYAIEGYMPNCKILRQKNIEVTNIDIEKERLPFEDKSMDIVIANQIIEHTKEIFWIFSEISRILKPGGKCIIGIPNLASFHNRIMLFLGMQPPCIDVVGPHVRAFTYQGFRGFVELDAYFRIDDFKGSNFYPFSPSIAQFLCKLFPKSAVALFFEISRTQKPGEFKQVLDKRFFETPFYTGNTGNESI